MIIMICSMCKKEHPYKNPKQFSSWIRRHRKIKHSKIKGKLTFHRKDGT